MTHEASAGGSGEGCDMNTPPGGERKMRRVGVVATVLVVVGGLGYVVYGGLEDSLVYFLSPTELLDRGAEARHVPVRLGGEVASESVHWDAEALDLRFAVEDAENRIEVHSEGAPPQMFTEGIEVIVEGSLDENQVFHSTNLMVKHSNEYRAPEKGQRPQDLYHQLLPEGAAPGGVHP